VSNTSFRYFVMTSTKVRDPQNTSVLTLAEN